MSKILKVKNSKKYYVRLPKHEYVSVIASLSQSKGWSIKQSEIPETWTVTQGEGIKIMVIDTGWTNHIDIGENCQKGICTVKGSKIDDLEGHSTHCIGTICAKNNDTGMVGVAPKAQVIAVKALGDDGMGSYDAIVKALEYAIEQKPDIVSMSLGGPVDDSDMQKAIKTLYDMNIPVIVAAGNEGEAGMGYPALYPETIAVAAYDEQGFIANFSSRGERLDWAAPGVDIYSTFLNNKYVEMNGTSMATPFLAGTVALLLAKHKKQELETGKNDCKTVSEIRQHLLKYTVDKGYVGKDKEWGYGIVNIRDMILDTNDPELNLPVSITKKSLLTRIFRNVMYFFTGKQSYLY